jgi:DNA repair protein RecO (recombination protein O)
MRKKVYKAQGVILKRKNYRESDRIITVLTREFGKIKTIAKGVRKISSRRSGHLEIFTNAKFILYEGRAFDYITQVSAINHYEPFRNDLRKASCAYYVCELADYLLPDGQEHPEMYERLCQSFSILAETETEEDRHIELYKFALDMLWELGFLPRTKRVAASSMHEYIEYITERRLKTLKLLKRV